VAEGAESFLHAEYRILAIFMVGFGLLLFVVLGSLGDKVGAKGGKWISAIFSTMAFLLGAITSILCGWVGMSIAVIANARVAVQGIYI
jgi:Na+/H+-translocating membrane pyrophosphatase